MVRFVFEFASGESLTTLIDSPSYYSATVDGVEVELLTEHDWDQDQAMVYELNFSEMVEHGDLTYEEAVFLVGLDHYVSHNLDPRIYELLSVPLVGEVFQEVMRARLVQTEGVRDDDVFHISDSRIKRATSDRSVQLMSGLNLQTLLADL